MAIDFGLYTTKYYCIGASLRATENKRHANGSIDCTRRFRHDASLRSLHYVNKQCLTMPARSRFYTCHIALISLHTPLLRLRPIHMWSRIAQLLELTLAQRTSGANTAFPFTSLNSGTHLLIYSPSGSFFSAWLVGLNTV